MIILIKVMNLKVAIITNLNKTEAKNYTKKIIDILCKYRADIFLERSLFEDFREKNCDFFDDTEKMINACDVVLAVGGDGSIIHAAKLAARSNKDILGINLGRVGFISGLEKENICKLKQVLAEEYHTEKRILLSLNLRKKGKTETYLSFNDIVISRNCISKLVDINVKADGEQVYRYRADGIILATPTGSTAYSFSAGGPIVTTGLNCIVLTPICPHSMLARPIIFSDKTDLEVEILRNEKNISAIVDGSLAIDLADCDEIKIKVSDLHVNLINLNNESFCDKIVNKLGR